MFARTPAKLVETFSTSSRAFTKVTARLGSSKGLVFVVGFGQRTQNLSLYLANMRGWLADAGFWTEADGYVRFWAQEVYGDVRAWAVPGRPAHDAAQHLIDYVLHPHALARAGGDANGGAEAFFLRRAYVPLANAAWKWESAFGFTRRRPCADAALLVRADARDQTRRRHASRSWAGGPAWICLGTREPRRRDRLPREDGRSSRSALHPLSRTLTRRAAARRWARVDPPGDHVWCEGAIEGAVFNEGWTRSRAGTTPDAHSGGADTRLGRGFSRAPFVTRRDAPRANRRPMASKRFPAGTR